MVFISALIKSRSDASQLVNYHNFVMLQDIQVKATVAFNPIDDDAQLVKGLINFGPMMGDPY